MVKNNHSDDTGNKESPISIGRKNATVKRIMEVILSNNNFLLLGHTYVDEDCVSSLVAMALLLKKFQKKSVIYLEEPIQDQLAFFSDICAYNNIPIYISKLENIKKPDVIFILDTPKPDMIAVAGMGIDFLKDKSIPKIELDHHFSADAGYTGDPKYRLTMRASSTGEIIAHICAKLEKQPLLLKDYGITELYSRNIVLAILTGMIGDAKLGNYLFKRRDKIFYEYFLRKFNKMLNNKFYSNSKNISSADEILNVLEALSITESKIFEKIMPITQYIGNMASIIINKDQSKEIITEKDYPQFIDVIKRATNTIAENVSGIGMSAYYEPEEISDKVQFRIRASEKIKGIDLRPILKKLNISDGGGHPGAIGFRFPGTDILDLNEYTNNVVAAVKELLQNE